MHTQTANNVDLDGQIQSLKRDLSKARAFLAGASDGMCILDTAGIVVEVSHLFCQMLGFSADDLIGKDPSFWDVHFASHEIHALIETIFANGQRTEFETRHRRRDGSVYMASVSVQPLCIEDEHLLFCLTRDIDERIATRNSHDHLARVLDQSFNEIFAFDAGTLKFLNVSAGACDNLGYTEDELRKLTPIDIKPEYDLAGFLQLIEPLRSGHTKLRTLETVHRRKDGTTYPVEVRISMSAAAIPPAFVAIVQDITDRREAQAQIEKLAYFDELTGLPNRRSCQIWLDRLMLQLGDKIRSFSLLFLDFKRFKEINDTRGHSYGDEVLRDVAQKLAAELGTDDRIARIGGDEFVVLSDGGNRSSAMSLARRMKARLAEPLELDGAFYKIDVSIGVAVAPFDGQTIDDLMRHADIAMYQAKGKPEGISIYTSDAAVSFLRRAEIAQRLGTASDNGDLHLVFQPQIDIKTGSLVGAETLVRWSDPVLGPVNPGEFIPIAEERGLIGKLGDTILAALLEQLAEWQTMRLGLPPRIGLNISPRQILDPSIMQHLAARIDASGFPYALFELEITEQQKLSSDANALMAMRNLQKHGVRIAVDDFGIGYSSLAAIQSLRPDLLKIDRSFIAAMDHDPVSVALIEATVELAHRLGIEVIAEGIEAPAQRERLAAMGCGMAQGYLFDPPMSAERFQDKWLKTQVVDTPNGMCKQERERLS